MIIYSRIVLKVKSSKLKIICYNAFPTHMLNIYIKQYYRTTN